MRDGGSGLFGWGEEHSDSPKCADRCIAILAQKLNDNCPDHMREELLSDLPWRIVGTACDDVAVREARGGLWRGVYTDNEYFVWMVPRMFGPAAYGTWSESLSKKARHALDQMISLTEPKEAQVTTPEKAHA